MPSVPELYKDKIEVSLDGRQIFYLFFGGAAIVGLVFVLGVLVGRRVEARGHLDRAETQAASDPLAALDRLERSDNLSFHGALTGSEAPTDVEKAIGELDRKRAGKSGDKKPEVVAAVAPVPAPASEAHAVRTEAKPEKPQDRPEKAEQKPERADASERLEKKPEKQAEKQDKPDKAEKQDKSERAERQDKLDREREARSEKSDARGEPVTRPDGDRSRGERHDERKKKHDDAGEERKPDRVATRGEGKAEKSEARSETKAEKSEGKAESKPRFTLQLSSFQDRSEAESFVSALRSAGFQPSLTEADVAGKGTFYRVRLGTYRSVDAANDAKAEFERASHKSAQVMRL